MKNLYNPLPTMKKIRRSVWLPTLLAIYLIAMLCWFAPSLIAQGEITRLIVVSLIEIAIIVVLFLFLREREQR